VSASGQSTDNKNWTLGASGTHLYGAILNDGYTSDKIWLDVQRSGMNITKASIDSPLVGIGKTNPTHSLDVSGNLNFTGTLYQNGNVFSSGSSSQWTTSGLNIYYNGGNVSIGKTTNSYAMDISGSVSAVSFNATSDYRIKDNVVDISSYSIDNVKPRMYFNKMSNKYEYGFIADELQMEYPLLVNGMRDDVFENGEPNLQTVNYIGLIPLLVREIQELKKKLG
jgi:hypothetical protein